MASRGRGRGGRGGGGRGGPPTGPVARDDDGTVLATHPLGPPPLFPETVLPEHPEITAKETLLLLRRNDLINNSKTSPFFLETHKHSKDALDAGGGDKDPAAKRQRTRQPLSAVMTLLPEYFPDELYSTADKKGAARSLQKAQENFWKSQAKKDDPGGLQRLDQLAQLESKAKAQGTAGGDDEPPEEAPVIDTDEEEDMEYDDYYQGEQFDDDEGYDEGFDDGGGDEGPVY